MGKILLRVRKIRLKKLALFSSRYCRPRKKRVFPFLFILRCILLSKYAFAEGNATKSHTESYPRNR